jgi:hypothetical protein
MGLVPIKQSRERKTHPGIHICLVNNYLFKKLAMQTQYVDIGVNSQLLSLEMGSMTSCIRLF